MNDFAMMESTNDATAADKVESSTIAALSSKHDGHNNNNKNDLPSPKKVQWVRNPTDGSVLLDHNGNPISVNRILATKPLRGELSTRPGPGNKKLTYISGEGVSRTLNDIFGFDGWNLDINRVQREECLKEKDRYHVVYTAQVRLTHKESGAYKEDCGAGDSTDKNFGTAVSHALKASITDAMKRAARHFGDKLGNSLYQGNFSISKAPASLKDALDKYEIERANAKFGFPKDQTHNADAATALKPIRLSAAGKIPSTATGSAVPHVTIKQETSSHKPNPQGMKPEPRRVSDQGCAPHKQNIAMVAAPQARQSGPPRRVSDQGYAPTSNREYPAQPTIAQTPKLAHVTANRTVGSIAASTGSHQGCPPPSYHHASAFPTHDNVPGTSPIANNSSRPAPPATAGCKPHNTSQMPPPTPSQGLFQSSLFGGGNHNEPPPLARPSTSSGRKSMDAISAPPLVTPVTLKRPPLVHVQDLDPNSVSMKKPNFNPYANHYKRM